jgi:hypothetical protein
VNTGCQEGADEQLGVTKMPNFLREPITVPIDSLYLDPNNPRLARDDQPGYKDPDRLFDPELQKQLETEIERVYAVSDLEQAILGQGWMPIDALVVWTYPGDSERHIVVEGNTRTVALRRLRGRLAKERAKLERMRDGKRYAADTIAEQERLISDLKAIVAATETLRVVPLDADSIDDLERKLPRVLAVRHITGAKGWGNYAQDLWLLARYEQLWKDRHPHESLKWEQALISLVADEASMTPTAAKRRLKSASFFSHFKAHYEDRLPEGEEFKPSDYYLFELITRKPWSRKQFGIGEEDLRIPDEGESAIFEWVFKDPRPATAEDNPNKFYRHENVQLWEQINNYDTKNGTSFATRFDVADPASAPKMIEVEVDYLAHKSRRKPADVLERLLQALDELNAGTIRKEGEFLRLQLKRVDERVDALLRMINVAADAPGYAS